MKKSTTANNVQGTNFASMRKSESNKFFNQLKKDVKSESKSLSRAVNGLLSIAESNANLKALLNYLEISDFKSVISVIEKTHPFYEIEGKRVLARKTEITDDQPGTVATSHRFKAGAEIFPAGLISYSQIVTVPVMETVNVQEKDKTGKITVKQKKVQKYTTGREGRIYKFEKVEKHYTLTERKAFEAADLLNYIKLVFDLKQKNAQAIKETASKIEKTVKKAANKKAA